MNTKVKSSVKPTNFCKTELEILQNDSCKRMIESYFDKNKTLNKFFFLDIFNQIIVAWTNKKWLEVSLEDIIMFLELIDSKSFIDHSNNYLNTVQRYSWTKEDSDNFFKTFNVEKLKQYLIKILMDGYKTKIINSLNDWKELNDNETEIIIEFHWKKLYKVNLMDSYFLVEGNKILWEFYWIRHIEDLVDWDKIFRAWKRGKEMYISLTTWLPIWWEFDWVWDIEDWVNWDKVFKAWKWNKYVYISLNTWKEIS